MTPHDKTKNGCEAEIEALNLRISELSARASEDRKLREALVEESRRRRLLLKASPDAVVIYDENGRVQYVNPAFINLYGWSIEELADARAAFVPEEHVPQTLANLNRVQSGQDMLFCETQRLTRNGRLLDIDLRSAVIRSEDGRYLGVIVIHRDITEQKKAESALRAGRKQYQLLLEALPDPVSVFDLAGRVTYVNRSFHDTFGWSLEELSGGDIDFVPEKERSRTAEAVRTALEGNSILLETRRQTRDGRTLDIHLKTALILDLDGSPVGNIAIYRDVTENRRALAAFQESEARYRELMEAYPDAVVVYDKRGRVTYLNPAFVKTYGWSREEVLGRTIDFVPPEEIMKTWDAIRKTTDGARDVSFETRRLTRDGTILDVELRSTTIFDKNGEHAGSITVHRDISIRKKAEEALRESEERNRLLLDASPDPITVYDKKGRVTYLNPAFEHTFGWTMEELSGQGIDFVPLDETEKTSRAVQKTLMGESVLLDTKRLTKDGRRLDIQLRTAIFRDRQGRLAGDIVIYRDITERKKAENDLKRHRDHLEDLVGERTRDLRQAEARYRELYEESKKAEALYRSLINASADAIVVYDLDNHVQYLNPAFTQVFGWTLEDLYGRPVDFVPPEEKSITLKHVMAIIQSGHTRRDVETRRLTKDGRVLDVNISASRFNDHEGNPAGMVVILRDVSEKVRMERELIRTKDYLQNLIDSMPSVLVGVDEFASVTQWNKEASRLTGLSSREARGQPLGRALPLLAEEMHLVHQCIRSAMPCAKEKIPLRIEGELQYFDMVAYPLTLEGVTGAVVRLDNVTDRARIEEVMIQTEKMMSVGGLAAGMAHEINNPLGGVIQGAQNIKRRLSPDLPANRKAAAEDGIDLAAMASYLEKRGINDFLNGILDSGQRAARIVANMLEFSRHSRSEMRSVNLAELLDKTVELAASDYDLKKRYDFRHIAIERDYDPDLPEIFCDPTKIEQVVFNLLRNAAQAMCDCDPGEARRPCIRLRSKDDGDFARIELEDNGPGMSEDVRQRVFEPFFTTKQVGAGTGLGLSVAYFIITDNHQGRLSVVTTPGQGARFIIQLPKDKRRALR